MRRSSVIRKGIRQTGKNSWLEDQYDGGRQLAVAWVGSRSVPRQPIMHEDDITFQSRAVVRTQLVVFNDGINMAALSGVAQREQERQ